MDNKNYQNYQSSLRALLDKALVEGLKRNEAQTKTWQVYKKAHEKVKKGLEILPQELTTNCMVPIGRKALMKGKLVHTNEILVCLGEGYFAKYSAKQAAAVCNRRIKQAAWGLPLFSPLAIDVIPKFIFLEADEMLINLEKERNLLEMRQTLPINCGIFGDDERQEIIETYDEEEEKQWRIKHRQREKEYRQKLAALRDQEKTEIKSEEDLWQRLDELELEEELDDEINRLHEENCNYYGEDVQDNDDTYEDDDTYEFSEDEMTNDMIQEGLAKLKNNKISKHQKDLLEIENLDKEADCQSSKTHSTSNFGQLSSNSSLSAFMEKVSSTETIDEDKSERSSYTQNTSSSAENKSITNLKDVEYFLNQNSDTSVISTEIESVDLTDVRNVYPKETSSQSKVEDNQFVRFESQPQDNIKNILSQSIANEGEFSRENNIINDQIIKRETNKRRVSFTDKIQVNVFEKSKHHSSDEYLRQGRESSDESDVEDEFEKLKIIEDMMFVGADFPSTDKQTENSVENEDESDDIIRIKFKHSDQTPQIPVKSVSVDTIEDPWDIYRIFCKPRSILKKPSGDVNDYQNIVPSTDDISDPETVEQPFGTSYTIIVKDVEERKPELSQVNISTNKTRPLSKFKMARSGIK